MTLIRLDGVGVQFAFDRQHVFEFAGSCRQQCHQSIFKTLGIGHPLNANHHGRCTRIDFFGLIHIIHFGKCTVHQVFKLAVDFAFFPE